MSRKLLMLGTLGMVMVLLMVMSACGQPAPTSTPTPTAKPTTTAPAAQPINLVFGSYMGENINVGKAATEWIQNIEKKSGGRIAVKKYWSQQLFNVTDTMNAVPKGVADIAMTGVAYYLDTTPLSHIVGMPFIAPDPNTAQKAFRELMQEYPQFQKEHNDAGVRSGWVLTTHFVLALGKPVYKLEDLANKKVRAAGISTQIVNALGMVPVAIALPEVFEAVQKNVLDAVTMSPALLWGLGVAPATPHMIDVGAGAITPINVLWNLKTWNSLPADLRAMIEAEEAAAEENFARISQEVEKEMLTKFAAEGWDKHVITIPSKAELDAYAAKAAPPIWADWIKTANAKGFPAEKALNRYKELVAKYVKDKKYLNFYEQYQRDFKK